LFPDVSEAICAELGVAEGLLSRDILPWGVKKLYSVDLWESKPDRTGDVASPQDWHNANFENVKKLLKPFGDRSEILRGDTSAMARYFADLSCDLVYIDADHSYQGVKSDIDAWWPKIKVGGVMAFHDYEMTQYGVKQAVNEFAHRLGLQTYLLPEDALKDAGAYIVKHL
jgi:hypothetical protein